MKLLIRFPATAVDELSTEQFVKACVAFQQAKSVLSHHLNDADVVACDNVSRAVYSLANRALAKKTHPPKLDKRGRKMSTAEAVVQAVRGKSTFTNQSVIDAMKRQGTLPKSQNIKGYISAVLSVNSKTLFKRVNPGVYSLRGAPKKRLVFSSNKTPKALPEKTA